MKGLHLKILKFLYANDNGDFLDVMKAFKSRKAPSRTHIEQIFKDLHEYIELESIYNYRGIVTSNDEIPETPLLKARITQKGRDYYCEQRNKRNSVSISKRNLWIGGGILAIAVLTFYFTIINPIKKPQILSVDDANFPNPILCLKNSTNDTVYFGLRQDFILWLPETVYGDQPNITGTYELIIDESKMIDDIPFLVPDEELQVKMDIMNKSKFYRYYLQNENEITIQLRTINGKRFFSTPLPFNEKWVSKYCTELTIE